MSNENISNIPNNKLSNTLFFSSLKNEQFDYTIPLKANIHKFVKNRSEVSPSLFEYLCYKITKRKNDLNELNNETAIISEKFLTSKTIKFNTEKLIAIHKPYIFIPIRNENTQKWNAVLFINLERQIFQYMSGNNSEPIFAKIISSNYESDEDDIILNTTMDKLENAFNFTSPDNIQFEVDSINISDQPNTSIFLLNFIEGLICQKSDEIFGYIMKLYDQNCNNNLTDGNNYFVSFNKENDIFNDLINVHQNEMLNFFSNNNININQQLINENNIENEDINNNEPLEFLVKDHSEQMGINIQNLQGNQQKFNGENYFGIIQEVDNESEDESEQISRLTKGKLLKENIDGGKEILKNNNIDNNKNNNNEKDDELLTKNDNINKFDSNFNEAENNENQTTDDYINVNNNPEEKNDDVISNENQNEKIVDNENKNNQKNNIFDEENYNSPVSQKLNSNIMQNIQNNIFKLNNANNNCHTPDNSKQFNKLQQNKKENLSKKDENIVKQKKELNNKKNVTKIDNQKLKIENIKSQQEYTNYQMYVSPAANKKNNNMNKNLEKYEQKNNLNNEYVNLINIPEDEHTSPIPILNASKSLKNINTDNSMNNSKEDELSLSQLYNECKKINTESEIKITSPAQSNNNKLNDNQIISAVKMNNEFDKDFLYSKSNENAKISYENNVVNNEKLKNINSCKNLTNENNMPKIKKKINKNAISKTEITPEIKNPRAQLKRKFVTNNSRKINNVNGNKINKNNVKNNKLSQNQNNKKEGEFEQINKICERNELHNEIHEVSINQKRKIVKSKLKLPPSKNNSNLIKNVDEYDDFKLTLSRDMNCGCVGDLKNGCNIF